VGGDECSEFKKWMGRTFLPCIAFSPRLVVEPDYRGKPRLQKHKNLNQTAEQNSIWLAMATNVPLTILGKIIYVSLAWLHSAMEERGNGGMEN
jgi:hypothetical protein